MSLLQSPAVTVDALVLPVLLGSGLRLERSGRVVFDLPQLALPTGVTWLGGGEGRGKSSLLQLLAGDLRVPGADLQLQGVALAKEPKTYCQQVFWMDPRTNTHDAVVAGQFLNATAARYPRWDAVLQAHLVEVLGLGPHIDKPLYMHSTGSKRKVWLTAALASGAALTLLDEPFAALDRASIRRIVELLQDAAHNRYRAWVVADYEAPPGVPLAHTIYLGD
ncbi:MAG: ATP-binding cassette domain-containing protein [Rhodoferax sp.]|nr:ATP-binding cassette domain-containing protein [Rhodoferax sp.]